MLKSNMIYFPPARQLKVVTSHRLFRTIQASVHNNIINQSRKCTFGEFVMNMESNNMSLVPYNFDPEYSVEEINSHINI
jgi:hypothetical protein